MVDLGSMWGRPGVLPRVGSSQTGLMDMKEFKALRAPITFNSFNPDRLEGHEGVPGDSITFNTFNLTEVDSGPIRSRFGVDLGLMWGRSVVVRAGVDLASRPLRSSAVHGAPTPRETDPCRAPRRRGTTGPRLGRRRRRWRRSRMRPPRCPRTRRATASPTPRRSPSSRTGRQRPSPASTRSDPEQTRLRPPGRRRSGPMSIRNHRQSDHASIPSPPPPPGTYTRLELDHNSTRAGIDPKYTRRGRIWWTSLRACRFRADFGECRANSG